MFDLLDPSLEKEKCYTTIGALPAYLDPKQPPSKSPFTAIKRHSFIHTVCAYLYRPYDFYILEKKLLES